MSTGTTWKKLKRRFRKKLYHLLLPLGDVDFGRLRPVFYLILIAGMLLAWAKLPTKEENNAASSQAVLAASIADSVRSAVSVQSEQPVPVVALFLPQEATAESVDTAIGSETLYSFYLTGKELSYLAEGAITTVSKDSSLYLDGISFTYHKYRLPFNRVTELSISGAEIADNQLYHVVSTEDIFALFHYISYRSIGIMSIYPKDAAGSLLSDYQEVMLTETGTPFTVHTAMAAAVMPAAAEASVSVVTMQRGFNLIDLVKEPNRITLCVCALFLALFALLWYIVPRMNRIRVWFRIYRIRSRKRSTHTLYGIRKRF